MDCFPLASRRGKRPIRWMDEGEETAGEGGMFGVMCFFRVIWISMNDRLMTPTRQRETVDMKLQGDKNRHV